MQYFSDKMDRAPPHTRGSTQPGAYDWLVSSGSPAHAGIDRAAASIMSRSVAVVESSRNTHVGCMRWLIWTPHKTAILTAWSLLIAFCIPFYIAIPDAWYVVAAWPFVFVVTMTVIIIRLEGKAFRDLEEWSAEEKAREERELDEQTAREAERERIARKRWRDHFEIVEFD